MIIVNFSTDQYKPGQDRLANSLNGHKKLMLNNYTAIGSPNHKQSPYEFKYHSILKAFQFDPIVLYMDASMYVVGDLAPIEKIIEEEGFFGCEAGHYVDDWCNEHTRKYFNLTEKGFTMFSAGLLGLNRNNERAMEFLKQWGKAAKAGCFRGEWSNHRHDMTSASIIAQRMGLKYQRGGSYMAYVGDGYPEPEPGVVIYCQGII